LLITILALKGADLMLPNFNLHGGLAHLIYFGIVLGCLNWLVKPVLVIFSAPIILLTIGIFYLVLNALILYIASLLLPGVLSGTVAGFFFGGIFVSLFHWILTLIFRVRKHE